MITCSFCNQPVQEGADICPHCGGVLAASAPPSSPAETLPGSASTGPGRLVLVECDLSLPLQAGAGELLIGRADPVGGVYPEIDLSTHGGGAGGVSRRHARLVLKAEGVFLEDLNSTNFTFLNRQRLQPGRLYPLRDGDEIRLGNLALVYYK